MFTSPKVNLLSQYLSLYFMFLLMSTFYYFGFLMVLTFIWNFDLYNAQIVMMVIVWFCY